MENTKEKITILKEKIQMEKIGWGSTSTMKWKKIWEGWLGIYYSTTL